MPKYFFWPKACSTSHRIGRANMTFVRNLYVAGFLLATVVAAMPTALRAAQLPPLLHQVTAGGVTAHFGGKREKNLSGRTETPLEFFVTDLWFTFAGDRRIYRFRPTGELHFSDWRFDIFAPNGRRVLLLQDRFGPYHVVRISRLKAYLSGSAAPERVIRGNTSNEIAGVHHGARWTSDHSIEFEYACCGTTEKKEFLLPDGRSQFRRPGD